MPAVAVSSALCDRPRKLTTTMGPTMSSATYSVTRRAKLRACFDAPQEVEAVLDLLDGA